MQHFRKGREEYYIQWKLQGEFRWIYGNYWSLHFARLQASVQIFMGNYYDAVTDFKRAEPGFYPDVKGSTLCSTVSANTMLGHCVSVDSEARVPPAENHFLLHLGVT